MVLALKHDGHRIGCPKCGATATDLGEIDTREAGAQITTMLQQAQLDEWAPEPIVRNRNIYPEIPAGWRGISFDSLIIDADNRDAVEFSRAWSETPGGSLVLMGETGRGKTQLVAAIVNALRAHDADLSTWTWGTWSDALRGVWRQDDGDESPETFVRRMERCGILVVDDVTAEPTNRNIVSTFERVIDTRWGSNLSTLIATNAGKEQWRDWSGRAYSRLDDISRGMWLTLTGPDRRRIEAAA